MNLLEALSDRGFHSCIATTFCIGFDAYETLVLQRFRTAGCLNNVVLADAAMLAQVLSGNDALPTSAGKHYLLLPTFSRGLFHPKIILQLGINQGRLIVGSANLTSAGLGGNLEVIGMVGRTADDPAADPILAAAWDYVATFLPNDGSVAKMQRDWALARTPWLSQAKRAEQPIALPSGGSAMFLSSPGEEGLAGHFAVMAGNRVRRLVVVSPFWDEEFIALLALARATNAKEVVILIGDAERPFPADVTRTPAYVHFHSMGRVARGRFVHAKLIVAQTPTADHVLFGSANCTAAALGVGRKSGKNQEACLYRHMERDEALAQLGLAEFLTRESRLAKSSICVVSPPADLPLDRLAARNPGTFELDADIIHWRPSPGFLDGRGSLEVLDAHQRTRFADLERIASDNPAVIRFRAPDLLDKASFMRIQRNGEPSALAPLIRRQEVLNGLVAADRRPTLSIYPRLGDPDAEEGFWLLELLADLRRGAKEEQDARRDGRIARAKATPAIATVAHRKLDYTEFMRSRTRRSDETRSHENFNSPHFVISDFLNRLLGISRGSWANDEDNEVVPDLEPETRDLDEIVDRTVEQEQRKRKSKAEEEARKREARQRQQSTNAQRKIVAAVDTFTRDLVGRRISVEDIIHMRAILSVLIATARPRLSGVPPKPCQTLESRGDRGWPRLVGRVLNVMFGNHRPAISRLKIAESTHGLRSAVLECWAISLWSIQAAQLFLSNSAEERSLSGSLASLRVRIYERMQLHADDLSGESFMTVFDAIANRFASRLGLDATKLRDAHLAQATCAKSSA